MKEIPVRAENIRLMGRDNGEKAHFALFWSGSGLEVCVRGASLEIEIDCAYTTHKPYLSFEVDGLRAQTFAPLNGRHAYSVFLNLNAEKTHHVRVIKETQPFEGDPQAHVHLICLRTDGELMPLPARRLRLEFIGDSITSGEGGRGPVSFQEWVPMVFCASDNYARLTAEALHADYQVLSQSGRGIVGAWNNDPAGSLPPLYDDVCAVAAEGRAPYDFSFRPDAVVIALGTNDGAALSQPAFTDAAGLSHQLTDSPEDRARLENAAYDFLMHVHEKNPAAKLVWLLFFHNPVVEPAVRAAVARAASEGLDAVCILPVDLEKPVRLGRGSRSHPGIGMHRAVARALKSFGF